jgi:hypothetical protein
VVLGAPATITAHMPSVVFEYAPAMLTGGARSPFEWLAGQGYVMFNVHARRHGFTGRPSLEIGRTEVLPAHGGNVLAVAPAVGSKFGSLTRLRVS